jgi:hypothetical protein
MLLGIYNAGMLAAQNEEGLLDNYLHSCKLKLIFKHLKKDKIISMLT